MYQMSIINQHFLCDSCDHNGGCLQECVWRGSLYKQRPLVLDKGLPGQQGDSKVDDGYWKGLGNPYIYHHGLHVHLSQILHDQKGEQCF